MIQTLFFDMDGTLVDTEPLHFEAHKKALASVGLTLTLDEYIQYGMSTNRTAFYKTLGELHGISLDPDFLGEIKTRYFKESRKNVQVLPEVEQILSVLKETYELSIVSSASVLGIEETLACAGIRGFFTNLYSAKDAPRPKPYPDVYLNILKERQLHKDECLVIEDSVNGVEAAVGAGIRCIVIPNVYSGNTDFSSATRILTRFSELPETIRCLD